MAYCGNCGTQIKGGKFCPKCGSPIGDMLDDENDKTPLATGQKSQNKHSRSVIGVIVALIIGVLLVFMVFFKPHLVNQSCDYCHRSPSMEFETSDGSKAYVCKECSKECMICHKKATKHYENLIGTIVFVCDDCYKEVTDD